MLERERELIQKQTGEQLEKLQAELQAKRMSYHVVFINYLSMCLSFYLSIYLSIYVVSVHLSTCVLCMYLCQICMDYLCLCIV